MRVTLRIIGLLFHIPAAMALLSLVFAGTIFSWTSSGILLAVAILTAAIGQILYHSGEDAGEDQTFPVTAGVALGWLLVPLVGALPYWLSAYFAPGSTQGLASFVSGYFESVSGFTSCGLTVCEDSAELIPMLQWWRSLSQWVGGLGMVVFAMCIIDPAESSEGAYNAEARTKVFGDSVRGTIYFMITCYVALGFGATIVFWIADMSFWEAINHGLTAVSTGGLTMNGDGMAAYDRITQVAGLVFFTLGAFSFRVYYIAIKEGQIKKLCQNTELRFFLTLLVAGTIATILIGSGSSSEKANAFTSAFHWLSAFATCGYSVGDISKWGAGGLLMLIVAMGIGGMAGSTCGGLKVRRLAWLVKGFAARLNSNIGYERGHYVWDGEKVDEEEGNAAIRAAAVLAALWGATLFVGTSVLVALHGDDYDYIKIAFEVTSALGGVGLSSGIVSSDTDAPTQALFTVLMWIGRLEILAAIALVYGPLRLGVRKTR